MHLLWLLPQLHIVLPKGRTAKMRAIIMLRTSPSLRHRATTTQWTSCVHIEANDANHACWRNWASRGQGMLETDLRPIALQNVGSLSAAASRQLVARRRPPPPACGHPPPPACRLATHCRPSAAPVRPPPPPTRELVPRRRLATRRIALRRRSNCRRLWARHPPPLARRPAGPRLATRRRPPARYPPRAAPCACLFREMAKPKFYPQQGPVALHRRKEK